MSLINAPSQGGFKFAPKLRCSPSSTSADTTIRLWTVSIDELLTQAQALIQRAPPVLTTEERHLYGLE